MTDPTDTTEHPTVPVQVWADVDVGIADLVRRLNTLPGVRTVASCQGGHYRPYVMVTWEDDAALALLARYPMTKIGAHHAYVHPHQERQGNEDIADLAFSRLSDGRHVSDFDVRRLVAEVDRLREIVRTLGGTA